MPEAATGRELESDAAERPAAWAQLLPLPCQLTVDLPVPKYCVADVLHLEPSSVVTTHWRVGADVPLRVNGELVAWGEFEVVENRLVVRLTELA